MNYHKLLSRGLTYANDAGKNWRSRCNKLLSVYVVTTGSKGRRLFHIINEQQDRISELGKLYLEFLDKQKENQILQDRQIIELRCPYCGPFQSHIIMVESKYYKPGNHRCNLCDSELTIDGVNTDHEMNKIFHGL